jgi:hypothetical protein
MSILADFFSPEIIHDGKYKFSQSGKYFAPPKGTYESYVEFIKVNLILFRNIFIYPGFRSIMHAGYWIAFFN